MVEAANSVVIDGVKATLRFSLASYQRFERAGIDIDTLATDASIMQSEKIGLLLWAFIAHDPAFNALSRDELAAMVDMRDMRRIVEAAKHAMESIQSTDPTMAPGENRATRRTKKS